MATREKFTLDIVFCLDVTGNNQFPLEGLRSSCEGLTNALVHRFVEEMDIPLRDIRFGVVAFRDFSPGLKEKPIEISPLFSLMHYGQEGELKEFVDGLVAEGGGDIPESTLDALAAAYSLPILEKERDRAAIILISNAPNHPYGTGKENPLYPQGLPATFEDFLAKVHSFAGRVRGLFLAPKSEEFERIGEASKYARHYPVSEGIFFGMEQKDLVNIIDRCAFAAE